MMLLLIAQHSCSSSWRHVNRNQAQITPERCISEAEEAYVWHRIERPITISNVRRNDAKLNPENSPPARNNYPYKPASRSGLTPAELKSTRSQAEPQPFQVKLVIRPRPVWGGNPPPLPPHDCLRREESPAVTARMH